MAFFFQCTGFLGRVGGLCGTGIYVIVKYKTVRRTGDGKLTTLVWGGFFFWQACTLCIF